MAKKTGRNNRHRGHYTITQRAPPKPVMMTPILNILHDQEATRKLLEVIVESSNGKRTLSRFARTCRAFCGPALDVLWRELDSLVPIIGLFPHNIMKKPRKPGFGLIRAPESEDWIDVIKYCDRVRRITYNEATNNLATVFPLLEDRPRAYILPNLEELTWKAQTASGLERASMFLNPTLKVINLQIESQLPQFGNFLADLASRTKLTGFSFTSPTFLPDNFTDLLHNQKGLEKVELVAPGALGSDIGKWSAKLPRLKSLQLDLTGHSAIAVEGFFDKIKQSGYDTPSSIGSHDSGIFSNEEFDYSEFKRSVIRLTDEDEESVYKRTGPFERLSKLQLTGDISNINVFLDHLSCDLTHLDLVIEDPPDRADWSDFCGLVCEKFGQTLQSLRITPTSKLVSKGEQTNVPLPLQGLSYLPALLRLDIDLPESCIFTPSDLERIGYACPSLEVLRLCPLARFQRTAPQISLEALGWLTRGCRNLQNLHVNVDAQPGTIPILQNRSLSSPSLQRLHFSNSWIEDPLQVSVLLSHLAPNLGSVKWFQDKNRPHYNETHDKNWQLVSETLPHLQAMRHIERSFIIEPPASVERILLDKCVDATVEKLNSGVQVKPQTISAIIQATPSLVSRDVDATVERHSICIDATPAMEDVGVEATVSHAEASIDACPVAVSVSTQIDTSMFQKMAVAEGPEPKQRGVRWQNKPFIQPVYTIFASIYRIFIFYPISLPSRVVALLEVAALLPEADKLAKSGKLQEALDKLFVLEKQTRNAADLSSTTRLAKAIIQHAYDARDFELLNSSIQTLSKKHGQLKAAIQAFVGQAIEWLPEIKTRDGIEKWLELVETLRSVTEGKIFLETPRARVTLLLSHHHEGLSKAASTPQNAKDSLQTASDLLSDLQVETYSSMERREKTEFILEQMHLLIAVARIKDNEQGKKDGKDTLGGGEAEWVKVRVGGRKVNEQFLTEKENEAKLTFEKLKYYDLMIQHALHHSAYLDVAKYYYKVWETPSIKEDVTDKGKTALEHIVYYVVLAPHNNEQSDMLHHLYVDPALVKLELHYNLVKCFVTKELMRWPGIQSIYGGFLRKTQVFKAEKQWEDLHTRVIEHNIRIIAEYYSRIKLERLRSLLDLSLKQTEEILSRLVVSGTVWARIDRPAGIVNFRSKRSAEEVMNDWSSDMQKLLGLVEKTWMGMNAAQAAQARVKAAAQASSS
ncbi:26S proteasome non-ATPase regulatory subunit 12 [Leucoagaricus sp. SymC.cos]|nr:26S proteasome non-ATPase regulatory subunit 12 [Leucoagaricus sp. SymC.cos]